MDGQQWAYYLGKSADLSELSDIELAELVEQYPYCQSLASLRAKKHLHSSDQGERDMLKISLEKAAVLSNDRYHLRNFLLDADFGSEIIQEDPDTEVKPSRRLEKVAKLAIEKEKTDEKSIEDNDDTDQNIKSKFLRVKKDKKKKVKKDKKDKIALEVVEDLENFEKEVLQAKKSKTQEKKASTEKEVITKKPVIEESTRVKGSKKKKDKKKKNKKNKKAKKSQKKNNPLEVLQGKEALINETWKEMDDGLSGFAQWLKERSKNQSESFSPKKIKAKKEKPVKRVKSKIDKLLAKSTKLDDRSVSETYIELLVKQGYIDKAIDLYQRLALKMPEKSGYFAAKIDDLKK